MIHQENSDQGFSKNEFQFTLGERSASVILGKMGKLSHNKTNESKDII